MPKKIVIFFFFFFFFAKSAVPQILNFWGLDTAGGVSVRLTFCNFALKIHALLILYFLPTRRSIYRFAIETLSLKMSEKYRIFLLKRASFAF